MERLYEAILLGQLDRQSLASHKTFDYLRNRDDFKALLKLLPAGSSSLKK